MAVLFIAVGSLPGALRASADTLTLNIEDVVDYSIPGTPYDFSISNLSGGSGYLLALSSLPSGTYEIRIDYTIIDQVTNQQTQRTFIDDPAIVTVGYVELTGVPLPSLDNFDVSFDVVLPVVDDSLGVVVYGITPLPGALPLFATSLGMMVLFWRRKQIAQKSNGSS
jgi:hypothetical protein